MKRTNTAGGVVIGPNNLVLVVNQHGRSWSLPKGHIESGESAEIAARREIEEESGVTELTLIGPLGSYQRHRIALDGGDDTSELKQITMNLYTTPQTDLKPIDPDNPEARWVKPKDVGTLLTHRHDKAFYESCLTKIERFISSRGQ